MTDVPLPPPLPEPPEEPRRPLNVDELLALAREAKEEEEAQAEESVARKHLMAIHEERAEDSFAPGTPKSARERKRAAKVVKMNARAKAFSEGSLAVHELTDEELRKGRFMDDDGKIRAREASMVPREFHDEFLRRLLERGHERLRDDFLGAIDTVTEIMYDADNNEAVRLRAAELIINRFAGKPQENVAVAVEVKPWQDALEGIIRTRTEAPIDAEVVDDDDDDGDER
jgi:hypothetical protein